MPRTETILAKAGAEPDPATGSVVPPIHLATTYERDAAGGYSRGFRYSRLENPTRHRLESALAELEGAPACVTFASGMAAVNAVFQCLQTGDHVILPDDVYFGIRKLATGIFGRWGLSFDLVDTTDPERVRASMRPETRLVWVETPSNPQLKITDIDAMARLAHEHGALLAVDGTWTTPYLQRPLDRGADLVMHSVTKYLSGHSDVLGGAICTGNAGFTDRLRTLQQEAGPVLDPFSSWLALRGLRTLAVRMDRQCTTAAHLAAYLDRHPRVKRVCYPGLSSHPGHATAAKQMDAFGGMLSFLIDGSEKDAVRFASETRMFANATSLGGVESLMEHRRSIEGPESPTPPTLIRISIGLEHEEDLIEDLEQAFGRIFG